MHWETVTAITSHPLFMLVLVSLVLFSVLTFALWKKHNVLWLLYAHLFFILSPLFLLAVKINCGPSVMNKWLSLCTMVFAKLVIYALPAMILLSIILGYFVIPKIYSRTAQKHNSKRFVKLCRRVQTKANLFLLDSAKPAAFTLGSKVFFTVGMFELLNQKEIEAVMMHELFHVKSNASWSKFSEHIVRLFSPIAWFSSKKNIEREEINADNFAVKLQGSAKFLNSAKQKVSMF